MLLLKLTTEPQGATWQKHVRGLANLIKLRGPQGFKSVRSLQVVTLVRILIVGHPILLWKFSDGVSFLNLSPRNRQPFLHNLSGGDSGVSVRVLSHGTQIPGPMAMEGSSLLVLCTTLTLSSISS